MPRFQISSLQNCEAEHFCCLIKKRKKATLRHCVLRRTSSSFKALLVLKGHSTWELHFPDSLATRFPESLRNTHRTDEEDKVYVSRPLLRSGVRTSMCGRGGGVAFVRTGHFAVKGNEVSGGGSLVTSAFTLGSSFPHIFFWLLRFLWF